MTYLSYIHSSGHLIVKKLHSPIELQESRRVMKRLIGTFEATNIEQARRIANQLREVSV